MSDTILFPGKDASLEYFPGWLRAEPVLKNIVDQFNPDVFANVSREPIGPGLGRVREVYLVFIPQWTLHYIPKEHMRTFMTIYVEFIRDLVKTTGDPRVALREWVMRYVTGPVTNEVQLVRVIRKGLWERIDQLYGADGITTPASAFKGWLGIKPYRDRMPDYVHERVMSALVLNSLIDNRCDHYLDPDGVTLVLKLDDLVEKALT